MKLDADTIDNIAENRTTAIMDVCNSPVPDKMQIRYFIKRQILSALHNVECYYIGSTEGEPTNSITRPTKL